MQVVTRQLYTSGKYIIIVSKFCENPVHVIARLEGESNQFTTSLTESTFQAGPRLAHANTISMKQAGIMRVSRIYADFRKGRY